MAPKPAAAKRKAPAEAPDAAGHGGTGRGQGRKAATKGLGPEVREGAPAKKQQVLADLLGKRFAKEAEPEVSPDDDAAAPDVAELIGARTDRQDGERAGGEAEAGEQQPLCVEWDYNRQDGDDKETVLRQRQRPRGRVKYDIDSDHIYILLAKGPEIIHYVDKENQFEKVEASHPNALAVEAHGGKLKIQLDNQDPIWVTWGHVQVVEAAGEAAGAAAAQPAAQPARGLAPAPTTTMPGAGNNNSDDEQGGGNDGGGIKAAARMEKKVRKRFPKGAKGHVWKPVWLGQFPWLRTEPQKDEYEWQDTPDESPDYMYCICCATFRSVGHNDVMSKKKSEAVRSDKLLPHMNAAHDRAVAKWTQRYGLLTPYKKQADKDEATPPSSIAMVDKPLAALVRTAVTVALHKSALQLVPTLIALQRANETLILEMNEKVTGIQTLLHAAAVVLRNDQNERLLKAGFYSAMGDGSNDRKNTEQVCDVWCVVCGVW